MDCRINLLFPCKSAVINTAKSFDKVTQDFLPTLLLQIEYTGKKSVAIFLFITNSKI